MLNNKEKIFLIKSFINFIVFNIFYSVEVVLIGDRQIKLEILRIIVFLNTVVPRGIAVFFIDSLSIVVVKPKKLEVLWLLLWTTRVIRLSLEISVLTLTDFYLRPL